MTDVTLMAAVPSDLDYHALVAHVKETFDRNKTKGILFRVTPANTDQSANATYLNTFSDADRQSHNCFTCRAFFKHYADLVYFTEEGTIVSAVWDTENAPAGYEATVAALKARAESGRIADRFYTTEKLMGTPENGNPEKGSFEHFHLEASEFILTGVHSAEAKMGDARTNHQLFGRAIHETDMATLDWLIHQFTYDDELASRNGLGILQAFKTALERLKTVKGVARNNMVWGLSQSLPVGAARLANTALGTYLEQLKSCTTDRQRDTARSNYLVMTRGDNYQRPKSEASEGHLNAAEKLIEKLGVAESLKRRAATLSDVQEWVWQHPETTVEANAPGGIFDVLRKQIKEKPNTPIAGKRMGWDEFVSTILPQAKSVQLQIPRGTHNYGRMLAAVNPDAPPILLWDDVEHRNTVSWYIYNKGSTAAQWGLQGQDYVKITGVVDMPCSWNGKSLPNLPVGQMLVLEGAREVAEPTLGLFPQILIRDLYPIRNALENLSNTMHAERSEDEFAGIILTKGFDSPNPVVRVLCELPTGAVLFDIVRWN